jgi:branched-chain amino acid transport system permease protein
MVAILGTNPRRVRVGLLAAGCALPTLAGTLGSPVLGAAPGLAHTILIQALVITVAGGPGRLAGTLPTALTVGQVHTTAALLWPQAAPYLPYALLAAALTARAAVDRTATR